MPRVDRKRQGRKKVRRGALLPIPESDTGEKLSGWDKIGGFWPHRLPNVTPEHQFYYAILRSAIETLVNMHNGEKYTGADCMLTVQDYWNVRHWIFGKNPGALVAIEDVCKIMGIKVAEFREFVKNSGL